MAVVAIADKSRIGASQTCGDYRDGTSPRGSTGCHGAAFHTLVVVALGITWILDGLEVTLAGAIAPALKDSPQLHFSNADVGLASSAYLAGAVLGASFFGWLTDRLGRKKTVLHHAGSLSRRHGGDGVFVESVELRAFPLLHRSGYWRRIYRDQFHYPGACSGALPRLDRSRHQWQLLDRRGARCSGSIVLLDPALIAPSTSVGGWRS